MIGGVRLGQLFDRAKLFVALGSPPPEPLTRFSDSETVADAAKSLKGKLSVFEGQANNGFRSRKHATKATKAAAETAGKVQPARQAKAAEPSISSSLSLSSLPAAEQPSSSSALASSTVDERRFTFSHSDGSFGGRRRLHMENAMGLNRGDVMAAAKSKRRRCSSCSAWPGSAVGCLVRLSPSGVGALLARRGRTDALLARRGRAARSAASSGCGQAASVLVLLGVAGQRGRLPRPVVAKRRRCSSERGAGRRRTLSAAPPAGARRARAQARAGAERGAGLRRTLPAAPPDRALRSHAAGRGMKGACAHAQANAEGPQLLRRPQP